MSAPGFTPEPFVCAGCGRSFPDDLLDNVANERGEPSGYCAECYSRERAEAALAVAEMIVLAGRERGL